MSGPKTLLAAAVVMVSTCMHIHTEFITPLVDTIAALNSFTCLTCDYPDRTDEQWFRDSTTILPGSEEESCNCEVFPNEGRICFNSLTTDDTDEYFCGVQISFGLICFTSAQLMLSGE